ncbi:MAG: pantoate kinase [Methanobrevibacter sp.]|nr:pantoate kinase [Methanobrevibacter sp.]
MKVSVFVPSHITGFFTICENKDPLKKGSCGAGLLIDKGVTTTIKILSNSSNYKNPINIKINGKENSKNETIINKTLELIKNKFPFEEVFETMDKNDYYISIENKVDVPIGAGFGTSASCALGTAMGLGKLLNLPLEKTAQIAHLAEISLGSGLGDVIGQTSKGVVLRKSPGAPGIGKTISISSSMKDNEKSDFSDIYVLTKTLGEIDTSSIIKNPFYKKNINNMGIAMQKKIILNPSLENFMKLSYEFAKNTNLMNENLSKIIDDLKQNSIGVSMAMLGNTIFALVKEENLNKIGNLDDFLISKIYTDGIKFI